MRQEPNACPCQGDTLTRFVQPIILAVLSQGPCHGYRLIQEISRTRLWNQSIPDPAGIYRTLRDMEHRGLIVSQPGQTQGGLGRRNFSLTGEGMACRQHWLDTLIRYQQGIGEVITLLECSCGQDSQGDSPSSAPAEREG